MNCASLQMGKLRERPHGLDIEGGHGVDNGTGK